MLQNIAIWIAVTGKIIWEYDKYFSNQQFDKNLSEHHLFMLFSLIVTTIIYFISEYFFKKNKNNFFKSVYWIIFITLLSACCRNKLGHDLNEAHFLTYSGSMFYCMYIHKQFYPKKEILIIPKIIVIWLIVLKVLWPPLYHVWPYWPRPRRPYREDLFDDWDFEVIL